VLGSKYFDGKWGALEWKPLLWRQLRRARRFAFDARSTDRRGGGRGGGGVRTGRRGGGRHKRHPTAVGPSPLLCGRLDFFLSTALGGAAPAASATPCWLVRAPLDLRRTPAAAPPTNRRAVGRGGAPRGARRAPPPAAAAGLGTQWHFRGPPCWATRCRGTGRRRLNVSPASLRLLCDTWSGLLVYVVTSVGASY